MFIPNWTTNRIICKKELGEKLLTKTNDGYLLDFNKLIPMPEALNIEAGSSGEKGLIYLYLTSKDLNKKEKIEKAYKSLNPFNKEIYKDAFFQKIDLNIKKYQNDEKFQESINLGKKYLDNYIKYGYCHWYNWTIDNWGTKWNVDDEVSVIEIDNNQYQIEFNTAWSCPTGILNEFSKMCNDGELDWMYYDEDYDGHIFVTKENGELSFRKEYLNIDYDNIGI